MEKARAAAVGGEESKRRSPPCSPFLENTRKGTALRRQTKVKRRGAKKNEGHDSCQALRHYSFAAWKRGLGKVASGGRLMNWLRCC